MKMKRKCKFSRLLAVLLAAVLTASAMMPSVYAADPSQSELTFAVVSGISYVAENNRGGYNDAFLLDAEANGYQYEQLDGILDSAFESLKAKVENENLKYIIVNGPLTYSGEYTNHAAVAEMLEGLEEETGVQVIVCPGVNDVNSASASTFASGKREYVTPATASQFRTLYADLGYDLAVNKYDEYDQNSAGLSYSVELDGGYRLVVIDASYFQYTNGYTSVTGRLSEPLLEWIETECTIARHAGQTLIGVCAWSLAGTDISGSADVLYNADEVSNFLADEGMHYVFTSGANKNDVSGIISDNGNIVYDVQSADIVSFPNTYRVSVFNGEEATFDIADADEVKKIVSRDGTEYEQPYRETASLKIQYADYDVAKYFSVVIKNYVNSILIPGVEKNGTLESFVQTQYGVSLTDYINELIGGGLNIMDIVVIFDATNIMNMLEDIFQQAQSKFLADDDTLADLCYERLYDVFDAEISSEKCKNFLDTYGFGDKLYGGTLNDFFLSAVVYSKCGNEDSSNDAFVSDVIKNLESGELVKFAAELVAEEIIEELIFEDILSQIEMKPQYLIFMDDTQDTIGYYLQIAFKAYIALHGEDASITGAVNSILADGFFDEYGYSIDDVLEYIIEDYYTDEDFVLIGNQMAALAKSYVYDNDPVALGDYDVTYNGTTGGISYATQENYRLPSMITVTPGNDTQTEAYVTWYTKSTVTGSDIEIYNDKNATFYGKHFIGVDGASVVTSVENIERTSVALDLGFVSVGETTLQLAKHTMKITGLEPGCTYFFRVGDSAKNWWSKTVTVTTSSDSDTTSFIHVSDTMGNTQSDFELFKNILDCADYLYPDTDFILHTGNYVDNNENLEQWQTLLSVTEENLLSTYILPVAGSNDSVDTIKNNFAIGSLLSLANKTGVYYSFDYNNIHIAVLDSNCVTEEGTLSQEQLDWLSEDMSKADARWKFVAIHDPVYTNGTSSQSDTYKAYMRQVTDLMEQYNIDLVFTGSDGVYYRTDGMQDNETADTPKVAFPHQTNTSVYYKTIPDPSGVVYSSLGSSGVLGTQDHEIYNVSSLFASSGYNMNPELPMFTAIEVMDDTLYLTTYTLKNNKATKIDSVSVKKGATLMGDVNFDGKVTAADARIVLRSAAQLELLTKGQLDAADMNGDSKVNATDARLVLRVAAGID